MAKKIRFPLLMDDGVEVRDINGLRDNFSLRRVMEYLENGKLITWLRDRYANDLADTIEGLDKTSSSIAESLCEIFGVPFDEASDESMEKAAERNRKLAILKEFTSKEEFIDNVDFVAFDQDDVYDLLDEKVKTIYLCGDKFEIPLSQSGISYIGVNNPVVVIDSKIDVDWKEKNISLTGIRYDAKYQKIAKSEWNVEESLTEKRCTVRIISGRYHSDNNRIVAVNEEDDIIDIISDIALMAIESDSYVFYFNDIVDETEVEKWIYSREAFRQSFQETPLWAFNKITHEKSKLGVVNLAPYMEHRMNKMFEHFYKFLCCSDNWVVYSSASDLFVCNVIKKETKYYEIPNKNTPTSGVLVEHWLYFSTGHFSNERRLNKVNLKILQTETICVNDKGNTLIGDIMVQQDYIYCFLGTAFESATFFKMDVRSNKIIEKVEVAGGGWIRNSCLNHDIVYFTLQYGTSSDTWSCSALDLQTKKQRLIKQFDCNSIYNKSIECNDDELVIKDTMKKEIFYSAKIN